MGEMCNIALSEYETTEAVWGPTSQLTKEGTDFTSGANHPTIYWAELG